MDYKNDERYWNINLLNKWFAISSILFLLSFIWMFYFDNDDEFKTYQKEFRKLAIQISEEKLDKALNDVKAERLEYESKYEAELESYNNKSIEIDSINSNFENVKGLFYKANMDYLFQKAEADGLKYLYEDEIVHSESEKDAHEDAEPDYVYKEKYISLDSIDESKTGVYFIPEDRAVNLDTMEDWHRAEDIMRALADRK